MNNKYNDGANYNEFRRSNQEYDIEHNVNENMYNEQPESLSLDRHDEIEFYRAAITPSTGSRENGSFIKKEKTNNRRQNQETSGRRGFADAPPPGDSGDDFSSSDNNGGGSSLP